MNAPADLQLDRSLAGLAFALLAPLDGDEAPEAQWLRHRRGLRADSAERAPAAAWQAWYASPPACDERLRALAGELQLSPVESVAAALASEVEVDAYAGRALSWLQAPTGGARPAAGLVAQLGEALEGHPAARQYAALAGGPALRSGVLALEQDNRPLPEAGLRMPIPLALALSGARGDWPGIVSPPFDAPPLPPSLHARAARYAEACRAGRCALVLRSGHPLEGRAVASLIARSLEVEPVFLHADPPPGFGVWAWLTRHLPVFCCEPTPGEQRALPALPGYRGPVLAVAGPDGAFTFDGEPAMNWRLPMPDSAERSALWRAATGDPALAARLGADFRHGAARIQGLAQAGRFQAVLDDVSRVEVRHVLAAGRHGAVADLGSAAELLTDSIADDALVLPGALRAELDALRLRCTARDAQVSALGAAARARHRAGVRALLYGPSGTGKTLAVGWLATRLGLPLYRVDLASVTSKYIGETEKNLARLFARAEHAEVVLMFDEADALFGKRTDVRDANDRYANAQTNYLLQRIETFDGIAILTSNSRSRFDSAFARRLDAMIEFPLPTPDERRALWLAHLGDAHALGAAELNRLAAGCDLAGGHIRNVVLAAAACAHRAGRPIRYADLAAGATAEYRKLGKQPPAGLSARSS